jgi:Na+-driven multidrug efflux pump
MIAFQMLCIVACHMPTNSICAHFSYALIYMVTNLAYMSLAQCLSHSIALSIEDDDPETCKKKISLGAMLCLLLSSVLIINIIHYRWKFIHIFIDDPLVPLQI